MRTGLLAAVLSSTICWPSLRAADDAEPSAPAQRFDRTIAPLLARRCLGCHNPSDHKGKLDLTARERALAGGESGAVIEPGDAEASLLVQYVEADEMPPDAALPEEEKKVLRDWIAAGAAWGTDPIDHLRYTTDKRAGYDWWALRPLADPTPPDVKQPDRVANPIDQFILARLEENDLEISPPAGKRTLIRRLSFDLLGLPPTPEDVASFLSDDEPGANERSVDRMLRSPHYGVRWARHWLDVVRFGESQGFERDKLRENAWPYRDWVVQALNDDLPYDKFARLQIAGDVLRPDDPLAVIATGFLVAGPWDEVGQSQQSAAMKAVVRQDELEDIVSAVGQTFLGLTVHCARCHDHKFDPIRQEEYYRLTAALAGVRHGERDLPAVEMRSLLTAAKAYAVAPRAPETSHLLQRGNPADPGKVVSPGGAAAVQGLSADFGLPPDAPDAVRRKRLAAWITNKNNPLFARVIVNRIWHYHFGRGLVETPSDFGFNGGRPSHPELLDWLACRFIESGYSLKALHRLIVTSATYRQGSQRNAGAETIDADNRLLWRKTPHRLEAEAVRDAMLAVAGKLNPAMGGPGYRDFRTFVQNTQFYIPIDPVGDAFNRRTLYRTWVRSGRNGLLDVLDCPDPSTKTPRRAVTTTPLQALSLLNNSFVLRMADCFSDRLEQDADERVTDQIDLAYRLAFARSPEKDEAAMATPFIQEHGLPAFCRALLNSNEFLYVD